MKLKKGAPETLDDLIDETDSEDEDQPSKKKVKQKGGKTGIVEDGENFVDFLDKTAPQHFTGKQSAKGKILFSQIEAMRPRIRRLQ